jgi:hypothetical protein
MNRGFLTCRPGGSYTGPRLLANWRPYLRTQNPMQVALPVVQSRRNARGLAAGVCLSSTTTGPLTRSREDTEGAATERSSRFPCTRTRFWSAPTAASSSYLRPASRTSTPSVASPIPSDAVPAGTRARRRGPRAEAMPADSVVAATIAGPGKCSRPPAAGAAVQRKSRSDPRTASPFIAAIASGACAATDIHSPQ